MATSERYVADEQLLHQLLSLLEVPDAAAKHGVELAPSSFRKPNAKGLELVLYRMYAIIHGEALAGKVRQGQELGLEHPPSTTRDGPWHADMRLGAF